MPAITAADVQRAKAAAAAAAARVASGQRGLAAAEAIVTVLRTLFDATQEMAERGARYNHEVVRTFQSTWNNLRGTIIFGVANYSTVPKLGVDGIWGRNTTVVATMLLRLNGFRGTALPAFAADYANWSRVNQSELATLVAKAAQRQRDVMAQLTEWTSTAAALEAAWHGLETQASAAVDEGTARGRDVVDQGTPTVPGISPPGARMPPSTMVPLLPGSTVVGQRPQTLIWPWVAAGVVVLGLGGYLLLGGGLRGKFKKARRRRR